MSELLSPYYDQARIRGAVAGGRHREVIGGLWDEIGGLQCAFLRARGLRPEHRLLDVGCGSLRGGVRFVRYLDPQHYYGCDLRAELIEAGYEREIVPAGLAPRLDRGNLVATDDFSLDAFPHAFDYAIAVSLFTHLPPPVIRRCLEALAPRLKPGGLFFASFFEAPEDSRSADEILHPPVGIRTFAGRDPYHQPASLFGALAAGLPWAVSLVGDWNHPRGQRMLRFERV